MEYKPFTALGLFSSISDVKAAMPKEKDPPVCEDSNISLELSLSLDHNTAIEKGKGVYYDEAFEVKNFGEKKRKGLSLEAVSDISLALSLSPPWDSFSVSEEKSPATDEGKQESFEVDSECSNPYLIREEHNLNNNRLEPKFELGGYLSLQLNWDFDDTCSSNKRKIMENIPSSSSSIKRKVSSCKNKRTKVEKDEKSEAVSTELRLGHDPWLIKKKLFASDLGNNARLLLASRFVETHVFKFWNNNQLGKIKEGLPVSVWDCDTETQHELVFKRWNNGANVLIKTWVKDFVKRRELKMGDEIGLQWDKSNSRFKFSVLNRAASH
ncbi:hypothetical protein REPUB_Repub10bG0184000 [Reevesia pubescens]